jgi:hypothetical protein
MANNADNNKPHRIIEDNDHDPIGIAWGLMKPPISLQRVLVVNRDTALPRVLQNMR